jgi:DNA-binding XRE family transcriptional regulator
MTLVQIEGQKKADLWKHSRRAAKVFKVPLDDVTDAQRKEVKDAIDLSHYTFGDVFELSMEEFFTELEKTPRDWMVHPDGRIGLKHAKMICPAVEVISRRFSNRSGGIGVTFKFNGQVIYDAADNVLGHDPEVRRRLLKNCGLLTE